MEPLPGFVSGEDLLTGVNEWRNIQDVVRLTLKSFHDVLKSQAQTIHDLRQELDAKVSTSDFLDLKERQAKTEERVEELEAQMRRVDEALIERPSRKELLSELQKRVTRVEHSVKASSHESKNQVLSAMSELQETVSSELKSLKTQMRAKVSMERFRTEMEARATVAEIGELLDSKVDRGMLSKSVEKLRSNFSSELLRKADKEKTERQLARIEGEVNDLSKLNGASLKDMMKSKADAKSVKMVKEVLAEEIQSVRKQQHEMELRIDADSQTAAGAFKSISASFDSHITDLQQIVDEQAFGVSGLKDILEHRIAATQGALDTIKSRLDEMVGMEEFEKIAKEKVDVAAMNEILEDRLGEKASRENVDKISERLDRLQLMTDCRGPDLNSTTVEDICTVLDRKVNTDDINSVLETIQNDIDSKIDVKMFQKAVRDQSLINASICIDSCVGRWIWKTGRTKAGHLIPWNGQVLNTDATNFGWEKDRTTILVADPGLYEINFCFFARKKPVLQLLVNGEAVIESNNVSSYIAHRASGSWVGVGRHSTGCVTGLSLVEFLSLPPKARVSVTYQGDDNVQGFLGLRKI
ncbi:hypothetical protein HOP50_12g67460 [Chloropicon primus]|uniref:C1q domain-containing protein n=2 Tax=Chloropicon primus TaxID=1764295 RepID=A0A5B8MUF9_9CHLO|nr:hypothetical protein A3770_12p67270 [Chloropicon primus]UPR03417.1 hypothetical protein HOP50_12g67460 [Chloropicon primus]|eukprot:QDZ24209.1 hypothetical protein A3770_12p67270 [Chloropicon primus]